MRIGLAQINPSLGDLDRNFQLAERNLDMARERGLTAVLFPELSLTGYFLKDMVSDVAMRLDDLRLKSLVSKTKGLDAAIGFVETDGLGSHFISMLYASDGEAVHVHRKVYLPTYGMFEDERFFTAGGKFRAFDCRMGRSAILICEDFWHLSAAYIGAMDGAVNLIVASNSPARGVSMENGADGPESRFESLEIQRAMNKAAAFYFGVYVLFVNRVGYEDGICFGGGSEAVDPFGRTVAEAPLFEEALVEAEIDPRRVALARLNTPLAQDEKLGLTIRELKRIRDERFKNPY